MIDPTKLERQFQLEEEMRCAGITAFRNRETQAIQAGQQSTTPVGNTLLRMAVEPTEAALKAFIVEADSGKAGRRHSSVEVLKRIDADVAALIVSRVVINCIASRKNAQATITEVGEAIEDEMRFRFFEEQAQAYYAKVTKDMDKRTANYKHKRRVLMGLMHRKGIEWKHWREDLKFRVGERLVDLFMQATGLIEKIDQTEGKNRTVTYITATERTMELIKDRNTKCELLTPVYLPMIVPPKDWSTPFNGGYRSTAVRRFTLVKTRNRNYLQDLRNYEMPVVYRAINAMQRSAFAVNADVLAVAKHFRDAGVEVAGLPRNEPPDLPISPLPKGLKKAEMSDEQKIMLTRYKREAGRVHDLRRVWKSKNIAVEATLQTAARFAAEDEMFFVYTMDFRGRVYATTSKFLNPQGDDLSKGLLLAAKGKPIGQTGAYWLCVHLANAIGKCPDTGVKVDKLTFDKRVEYVMEKANQWIEIANAPTENLWWTEVDSPWQALAALIEVARWLNEGDEYVSRIFVGMDGSNNGQQHFASMLRDEKTAFSVNVMPCETPQDIYQEVADEASRRVEADAEAGIVEAQQWKGHVVRAVVKRPVMTYCYGAKEFGFRQQIIEDTIKPWKNTAKPFPFEDDGWAAARYLAKVVWNAIGAKVAAAANAMEWLQKLAELVAEENLPIKWTTPAGLPVMQEYRQQKTERVKTKLNGSIVKLSLNRDTDQMDKKDMKNGISPNFVHSMDSSAMMLCINMALDAGVESFCMVHDSFGVLAADTQVMRQCTRESFRRMYEERDVMTLFRDEIAEQLLPDNRERIPTLPAKGSLDLSLVLQAEYFFA